MTSLLLEAEHPIEPFEWASPSVQIWCFLLLHDRRYIDFQTGHFDDFEQFNYDSHFANFGQVNIDPICLFLLSLGKSQLLISGKTLGREKQGKHSWFDKIFKNPA